jgi:hypothetical protein
MKTQKGYVRPFGLWFLFVVPFLVAAAVLFVGPFQAANDQKPLAT